VARPGARLRKRFAVAPFPLGRTAPIQIYRLEIEFLCYGRNVAQHRPEVAGAPCQDEEVPQLVETEDPCHRVWALETVDQCPRAVDESPREHPDHPPGGTGRRSAVPRSLRPSPPLGRTPRTASAGHLSRRV
jgi:hypothetical protein